MELHKWIIELHNYTIIVGPNKWFMELHNSIIELHNSIMEFHKTVLFVEIHNS